MGVVSCGTTMLDQGVFENIGAVSWDTTAKTSGFTAVSGNGYFVNTTSGAITVTLPSSPSAGDIVGIKDYANTADTNAITIGRNGSNIQGVASDFILNAEGRSVILVYVDATKGWLTTSASQASDIVSPAYVTATGGTVSCCGDYKIHTFTGPGTFTVTCAGNLGGSNTVDFLVVAGGGGGGHAGGGGAGGFRTISCSPVSVTGYPITIGAGGAGRVYNSSNPAPGNPSTGFGYTSTGGGAGGSSAVTTAAPGGSGGGNQAYTSYGGPSAIGSGNTPPVSPPQGNNGGASPGGPGGGGGGGASAVGANAPGGTGGAGGAGTTSPITGTAYAGGGGGGGDGAGAGGTGGGGAGASGDSSGTAGTANTGGGGGGIRLNNAIPGTAGGAGGSGIVIIKYKFQ